jgi:O-antigen ligase
MLGLVTLLGVMHTFALSSRIKAGRHFTLDGIDLTVIAFVLYATGRFYTGPSAYLGRLEWMSILGYAMVFFVARYAVAHSTNGLVLVAILLAVAAGVNAFAIYLSRHPEFLPYGERLHLHYAPRWTGSYGCPNHFGYFLVMGVSAALAFGFFAQVGWTFRIISFYLAGFFMVGVGFSLSRGSWIALFFALLGLSIFAISKKLIRWWIPTAGLAAFVMLLTVLIVQVPAFHQRVKDLTVSWETGRFETYVRVVLARDALKIIRDYPWWGTGPATFANVHPHYQIPTFSSLAVYTHNDYLNLLSDYGVVGGLLVLIFLVLVSVKLAQALRQHQDWPDRVLIATGIGAWAALLWHSLVDFNLHIPANAFIFFILIGLAVRRLNYDQKTDRGLVTLPSWLAPLGVAMVTLALLLPLQKTARAYFPAQQAQRLLASHQSDQAVSTAFNATKIDSSSSYISTMLGDYYRLQAAQLRDARERYPLAQQAEKWYRRGLQAEPLDETIRVRLAMSLDLMRRFPEAYMYYQQALKNHPYNGYFWAALGAHHFARGQLLTAKWAYGKSLECPAGSEEARLGLEKLSELIRRFDLDHRTIP